ncbi:MAG TPA: type II toxin-antitoxin system prevent-host-death family antitoxin [Terracidiphilus sp.]|nr:type II toxin-antitoxin system prevent-host-death family antitoxin [Terracidiphilus sp.]
MTPQVNIFEAKTNLSKLIEQVERGGEVIIARAGKPVARLTQLEPKKRKKPIRFGLMKGEIWVADDFDDPLPDDVLKEFEGDIFPPEKPIAERQKRRAGKARGR